MEEHGAIFPTYARIPLKLVKGEGSRLWDDGGKEYLDFMSGIAVTSLGHNHPGIRERVIRQMDQVWHVSNLFHQPIQHRLAELLTRYSGMDRVFYCNSGAEANEAAIKLARRYNRKVLGNDRYEIITFRQSFHGRTLTTLTATGQDKVKDGFDPLPQGFVHVPFNDVRALEAAVTSKTCAIMLELVQGEGGVHPADPAFVREIARLCKERDLLLIVDEIQTGLGRTGKWFAFEHYGIEPDVMTLAKALGNGIPIGAMLGKEKLAEAFPAGSHGSTFGGNALAVAAAIGVVETIAEQKLTERAAELGDYIMSRLRSKLEGHPAVRDIRGKGLLIGIECAHPVADVLAQARERGVLAITAGTHVIRLLPALTMTNEEADRGIAVLCDVLTGSQVTQA